jgi:hypothetical protein
VGVTCQAGHNSRKAEPATVCTHLFVHRDRLRAPSSLLLHTVIRRTIMAKTLVVLHGGLFPYQTVQEFCSTHNVSAHDADVTTEPAALQAGSTYSKAVVLCNTADAAVMGAVAKLLSPGSSVAIQLHQEQVGCRPCLPFACNVFCLSSAGMCR